MVWWDTSTSEIVNTVPWSKHNWTEAFAHRSVVHPFFLGETNVAPTMNLAAAIFKELEATLCTEVSKFAVKRDWPFACPTGILPVQKTDKLRELQFLISSKIICTSKRRHTFVPSVTGTSFFFSSASRSPRQKLRNIFQSWVAKKVWVPLLSWPYSVLSWPVLF